MMVNKVDYKTTTAVSRISRASLRNHSRHRQPN